MKTKLIARELIVALIGLGLAGAAMAEGPSWLDADARLMDQALAAKKQGVNVTDASAAILAAGSRSDHVVQAMTTAYGSCSALTDSVAETVRTEPNAAYDIVSGVAELETCPCSSDNVWPHTRLESRIRTESRRFEPVSMGVASNCVALAAKTAVEVAPDQARNVLAAVAGDNLGRPGVDRTGRRVVDSIGTIGQSRDGWQGTMAGKGLSASRTNSDCAGDRDPVDEIGIQTGWGTGNAADTKLGKADGKCERRANDVVISDYDNSADDSNAAQLLNNTAVDIDLQRGGYVLDVYGDGASVPSKSVPLKGKLMSGQSLVIAGENTDESVRKAAQLVTGGLDVSKVNALVLRRGGFAATDCSQVPASVGMIATALGDGGEAWMDETAQSYNDESNAQQVDAIGTVGAKAESWLGSKAGQDFTVARENSACQGDANAADDFSGAPGWSINSGAAVDGSTSGDCVANARDLVLSDYGNASEKYRAVTVFNNTGAAVDLADSGYVLEVYADGAVKPSRTIALKGTMKSNSKMVIVDDAAPADVKEKASMVSGELNASAINALVLKRINVGPGRACRAEIIAAARDIKLPLELVTAPFAPSRTPVNTDAIAGDTRGSELASPN